MKKNKYQLIEKNTGKVVASGEAAAIAKYIGRPITSLYAYVREGYTIHDQYKAVCLGKLIEKKPKGKGVGRPRKDPKNPFTMEPYKIGNVNCLLHHDHEGRLRKTTFLPLSN